MKIKKLFLSFGLALALTTTAISGVNYTDAVVTVSAEEANKQTYGGTVAFIAYNKAGYNADGQSLLGTTATQFAYEESLVSEDTQGNVTSKSYATMGDVLNTDGTFNEATFEKLDRKSQSKAVDIVCEAAQEANNETNDTTGSRKFSDNDYQNWMTQIEQQKGIGSKLMTTLMKNTKPDFATANKLYEPFSGVVGTLLGVLAIILMAALALVMVLDLSYIAIPFVRNVLDGGSDGNGAGGNGGVKSKFVSWEAFNAVQQVEGGGGASGQQGGESKTAIGIYFKQRIIMLLILGLCLLYLVQGEIFTLVGYFMDLVSGFLGF